MHTDEEMAELILEASQPTQTEASDTSTWRLTDHEASPDELLQGLLRDAMSTEPTSFEAVIEAHARYHDNVEADYHDFDISDSECSDNGDVPNNTISPVEQKNTSLKISAAFPTDLHSHGATFSSHGAAIPFSIDGGSRHVLVVRAEVPEAERAAEGARRSVLAVHFEVYCKCDSGDSKISIECCRRPL